MFTIQKRQPTTQLPAFGELVYGYDSVTQEEIIVRYRQDSNRFFDHPYTGAVYPLWRMNLWRPLK